MILNQLLENFSNISKDVPIMHFNGTSLYLDDILLIILAILLFEENSCDISVPLILVLLVFS